jgi:hypothetical protein
VCSMFKLLSTGVEWATILAAPSMFGVSKQHERWIYEGSGGLL